MRTLNVPGELYSIFDITYFSNIIDICNNNIIHTFSRNTIYLTSTLRMEKTCSEQALIKIQKSKRKQQIHNLFNKTEALLGQCFSYEKLCSCHQVKQDIMCNWFHAAVCMYYINLICIYKMYSDSQWMNNKQCAIKHHFD